MRYAISVATLSVVLLGAVAALGFYYLDALTPRAVASVELGITELSPRGEAGG
ncbi:MAG: hypothetical protein R3B69_02805 [Candidatus Paceibacterota bacterium]